MSFLLSSKPLAFLSFHNVHQMLAGINSHQSSSDSLLPISFQQSIILLLVLGNTQLTPCIHKNMFHRFAAILQCRNRWLFISANWSHIKHLEQICLPLLCSTSCVKQAFLQTNHTKQETFRGTLAIHISFQGHSLICCWLVFLLQ